MNQDELKTKLDKYTDHNDFSVIFSGKHSVKKNGIYYPEKKEIVIHNKNFTMDNQVIYEGLHELAHHIDYVTNKSKVQRNSHGSSFTDIFHNLIDRAISDGSYSEFSDDSLKECVELNNQHTKFLKKFGKSLITLLDKCNQCNHNFDDVIDRKLSMKKSQADSIMKVYALDISEDIGGDFARAITKINDPEKRKEAEKQKTLPKSKSSILSKEMDELSYLEEQQRKIDKSIDNLMKKREKIAELIEGFEA